MTKPIVILAPHVDDEMIGCFSALIIPQVPKYVFYFNEVTPLRKQEAENASLMFGFTPYFHGDEGFDTKLETCLKSSTNFDADIYVPSRKDSHLAHKELSARYHSVATHFYSVDMVDGVYLGDVLAKDKKDYLDKCYPSQAGLWASDAKYYLFESIKEKDYDAYVDLKISRNSPEPLHLIVLEKYAPYILEEVKSRVHPMRCLSARELYTIAASVSITGTIEVKEYNPGSGHTSIIKG